MLELFLLRFRDPRLAAALRPLPRAGRALGDLAEAPAAAAAFFAQLRASAAGAGRLPGTPASSAAAAAAEDFLARLERFYAGLALHGAAPDAAVKSALACLEAACEEAPPRPGTRLAALCAEGRAVLADAGSRAAANFPENIKYSSMYLDLDAAFAALERCAEAVRGA